MEAWAKGTGERERRRNRVKRLGVIGRVCSMGNGQGELMWESGSGKSQRNFFGKSRGRGKRTRGWGNENVREFGEKVMKRKMGKGRRKETGENGKGQL